MMYIEIVTEGIRTLACFHTPLAGARHNHSATATHI